MVFHGMSDIVEYSRRTERGKMSYHGKLHLETTDVDSDSDADAG